MQYEYPFTIATDTTKISPASLTMRVSRGIVKGGEIEFPPGPKGLCGVKIFHTSLQLYPLNYDEWAVSDDNVIPWDISYKLFYPPFFLIAKGYNLDDTYQHTPIIRVVVKRPEEIPLEFPQIPKTIIPVEVPIPEELK